MKRSALTIFLSAFVLVLMFSISGCNKDTNPTGITNTDPTLTNMIVADIQDDVSNVTDPNVDNYNTSMDLEPKYGDNVPFQCPMMSNDNMMMPGFINFMGIMRKLALTADQKTAINGFMKDYRDCIATAQKALRQSEKVILTASNAQIKNVMDSLKAGQYTKIKARIRLAQIAYETRKALLNNPALATFKTATCDCLHNLFDAIRNDLTAAQQTTWDAWVAKLKNKCINP